MVSDFEFTRETQHANMQTLDLTHTPKSVVLKQSHDYQMWSKKDRT